MSQPLPAFFSGPDRLERPPGLGRPFRCGAPEELATSDLARIRQALAARDAARARAWMEAVAPVQDGVVETFLEWALALPAALVARCPAADERGIAAEAHREWAAFARAAGGPFEREAADQLGAVLHPRALGPGVAGEFRRGRAAGLPTVAGELLRPGALAQAAFQAALDGGRFEEAAGELERWAGRVRARHDLLGQYVGAYTSAVQRRASQTAAADVMQQALESCPLLEAMRAASEALPPVALAAVLAEHLRRHFSGPGRDGAVRIVEEPDRYRLVFDPCGTGGAMRRAGCGAVAVFPEAGPETWGLAGQVPSYCSHCARNELTSISRVGHPLWVTEFDPDPSRPCGWTVYKDPALIPERYFARLGLRRDPDGRVRPLKG